MVSRIALETGHSERLLTLSLPDSVGANFGEVVLSPDGRGYAYRMQQTQQDLYLVEGLE